MGVTIKDVARLAGVGQATISSYLNGGNVREKNRIKIEQAIKELNFEVNEIARGLKTNKTKIIGVIIPGFDSNFYAQICMKIEDLLRVRGYAIIICDSRSSLERENEAIKFLQKKRVDGLIIVPSSNDGMEIKKIMEFGKPVILLDRLLSGIDGCAFVLIDNQDATRKATQRLIEAGHNDIGIIVGPKEIYTSVERKKGYLKALEDNNIECNDNLIVYSNYSILDGILSIKMLHEKNPNMSAVLLTNYDITIGGIIGLNELGIKVSENLAVIGFDSYEFSKAMTPNLSVIIQPLDDIAKNATEQLFKRLAQKPNEWENEIIELDTKFIEGKSI